MWGTYLASHSTNTPSHNSDSPTGFSAATFVIVKKKFTVQKRPQGKTGVQEQDRTRASRPYCFLSSKEISEHKEEARLKTEGKLGRNSNKTSGKKDQC